MDNPSKEAPLARIRGLPGFPMPNLDDMERIETTPEGIGLLTTRGIGVASQNSTNTIYVDKGFTDYDCSISFHEFSHSTIVIQKSYPSKIVINIRSNKNTAILCGGQYCNLDLFIAGDDSAFYCGPGSYIGEARCWVGGEGSLLAIGEDCMTGWAVGIRTADFHGVFDTETLELINTPRDTIVGPHVWLSHDVSVMKGSTIGAGSVIGAASIVTRPIPPQCAAAGAPATVSRKNVSWTRPGNPSLQEMTEILSREYITREKV